MVIGRGTPLVKRAGGRAVGNTSRSWWIPALLLLLTGCGVAARSDHKLDTRLQRHVKAASQAFAEGQLETAITAYRAAIRRAWALDDPYEAGTAAYNLAACLLTHDRSREAQDWLLDARLELTRAGASLGNVWLLEAKIAAQQQRFGDVEAYVQRASCSDPPCQHREQQYQCCNDDPCRDSLISRIPCWGTRFEKRQAVSDCAAVYQAQIHLLRARVAAEQYDLATARYQWSCAAQWIEQVCDHDLWAEREHVAALIHLAQAEYLSAARHFDREADCLRQAGNYREIPNALELAAAAYDQAGLRGVSADRICRVARILYGRGELQRSWRYVQQALQSAEAVGAESTRTQLALLANELARTLSEPDSSLTEHSQPREPELLAPANAADVTELLESP